MDDSRILIIGARGQLGTALQSQYPSAHAADSDDLDITDRQSVENFDWSQIDIILNAAAFTNVDGAETPEGRVASWKINAQAVSYLADVARNYDITLVHISTDYVFDGSRSAHTEDEPFSPLSVYGASKAAGDLLVNLLPKHYILRTSWVIGEGKNFVRTMLGLGQKSISPTVVADQVGRLTFTSELVKAINHLHTTNAPYGTYNLTNDGESTSWAEVTRKIFAEAGFKDLTVTDTSTAEYYAGKDGIAPRPLNSTLSLDKIQAIGFVSTGWQEDLHNYIQRELAS
jgi:dTDP-4-dehydrorhamnose 3,5-epimerase